MNREELKSYIGISGNSLGQVEKDYFQHIILGAISRRFAGTLVFKGGTALQKIGVISRFSEDLDFTNRQDAPLLGLVDSAQNVIKNYNFQVETNNLINDERTFGFRMKIQGPLYRNGRGICSVRVEISQREPVLLEPVRKELNPLYSDILPYIVSIMRNEEILSEKVRAIYTRQKARDLYDIYKILESGVEFDVELVDDKLKYYDLVFDKSAFLKKCKLLRPGWKNELESLIADIVPYEKAMEKVKDILSEK